MEEAPGIFGGCTEVVPVRRAEFVAEPRVANPVGAWEKRMAEVRAQTQRDVKALEEQRRIHDEAIREDNAWAKTRVVMSQPYDVPKVEGRYIPRGLGKVAEAIDRNTEAIWAK